MWQHFFQLHMRPVRSDGKLRTAGSTVVEAHRLQVLAVHSVRAASSEMSAVQDEAFVYSKVSDASLDADDVERPFLHGGRRGSVRFPSAPGRRGQTGEDAAVDRELCPCHVGRHVQGQHNWQGRYFLGSYAGFWVARPDQAARFSVTLWATPSVNVTPSMTKGNWFAPFRRRHVCEVLSHAIPLRCRDGASARAAPPPTGSQERDRSRRPGWSPQYRKVRCVPVFQGPFCRSFNIKR